MNLIKTPRQMVLEKAGALPATPGMVKTPRQAMLQNAGMVPHLAKGGKGKKMTPKMMRALIEEHTSPDKQQHHEKIILAMCEGARVAHEHFKNKQSDSE